MDKYTTAWGALDKANAKTEIDYETLIETALHYLGFFPDIQLADIILQKHGMLDTVDLYGNTPYGIVERRG